MKIVVNFDTCESKAVCMRIAPTVFEVRDDGFLYILQEEPAKEVQDLVEKAARGCPTKSISLDFKAFADPGQLFAT
jgi:ferredoxin